ncbi:hypothetical protein NMG60_11000899 [Bertholletia excelsa]
MGAKYTVFENRSRVEMEIRVFVPPARPDRYRSIIRIGPGESKKIKTKTLYCTNENPENPTFLMVYMDGSYSGTSLLKFHVMTYAKIIGYLDDNGLVILKGVRRLLPSLCGIKFSLRLSLHSYTSICTPAIFY